MRHATLLTLAAVLAVQAAAQVQPQMTWQGEVSGGATLFIQGNRVDMQGRTTGAVDRPTFRFRENLPAFEQTVTVGVRRGGGTVRVVEQPNPSNQYAAVVEIQNDGRPQMYRLEFFWDGNQRLSSRSGRRNDDATYRGRDELGGIRGGGGRGGPGSVTWSGEVDNEVYIVFSGRRSFTTAVRGSNVVGERAEFGGAMPRQDVNVTLVDRQGRGRVELIEQPNADNNYAAKVRIIDNQAGVGSYAFRLEWEGDGYAGGGRQGQGLGRRQGGVLNPSDSDYPRATTGAGYGGGNVLRWSGRVDGTIRVHAQGNRVWSERVIGGPTVGERFDLGSPIPRGSVEVDVRKLNGRDDVRLVQRPSAANGYTLIFEVRDDDGGADMYEVEATWR